MSSNAHARGEGPSVRADEARWQEEAWMKNEQPGRYKALLALLRSEIGQEHERALAGVDAICEYLTSLGVVNRYGAPVTVNTLKAWRRSLAFPMLRGRGALPGRRRASACVTTTFLVQAWLCSLFKSGGPRLPRIHRPDHSVDRIAGSSVGRGLSYQRRSHAVRGRHASQRRAV